jgi:single-strand DNA-binding protein
MSFSLNKIMLIGNLGRDAETRFTTTNLSVTNFTLATVNSYKGKDGNWINETTWHNIVGYNLSDYFKDNLKKGSKFYIEGRLQKREYTDKGGIKKYSTDVIVDKLIPLSEKQKAESSENMYADNDSTPTEEGDDLPF